MPLLHHSGRGRTRILLRGAESLEVMETYGHVLGQLDRGEPWIVVRLDEETSVHVRPDAVVALIDLGQHEDPHLRPAA
jgi:hypothetical protein